MLSFSEMILWGHIMDNNDIKAGIAPTKERHFHNGGVIRETIRHGDTLSNRYRAVWECPLDVYFGRHIISKAEYRAGLRFHRAYYGAVLCRRIDMHPTSSEQASIKSSKCDDLLKEAYATLPFETLGTVVDVCGHSKPLYSPRALETLRKGLGHLAIEWNMAAIEVCEHKP